MDIAHVASELAPFAKVGGLGDVITGLSRALAKAGHSVIIFLPKYDCMEYDQIEDLQVFLENFSVEENNIAIPNTLWSGKFGDLHLIFIEPHHPKAYFERGVIYGESDDNDRFLFFCKVASTYLKDHLPDVVHLHDWPSAACSLFLKNVVRTVFTIHNLQHQGRCGPFNLERLGLSYEEDLMRDLEYSEALNLLKGAIYNSSIVTTVSPSYLKEILTPEEGCGLDGDLQKNKKKLHGILNGIDIDYWNPETDSQLEQQYGEDSWLEGKKLNKQHLQKKLGLEENNKPLVISVTRLVPQKGPDLLLYGAEKTIELGGQFAILGSGEPEMEAEFEELSKHPGIAVRIGYDEPLAHLFYAAGDMLLMPSIFEPCGLTQMIALRYGCVPLVRATGGLRDTITEGKNGFLFDVPDNKGVANVLEKAFSIYPTEYWVDFVRHGMSSDFSWEKAAEKYLEIYT